MTRQGNIFYMAGGEAEPEVEQQVWDWTQELDQLGLAATVEDIEDLLARAPGQVDTGLLDFLRQAIETHLAAIDGDAPSPWLATSDRTADCVSCA